MGFLPGASEGRGGTGGEAVEAGAPCPSVNCSPKFFAAAARSGRGRVRSSGEKGGAKQCQGGCQNTVKK
jgi:hypothetical protein